LSIRTHTVKTLSLDLPSPRQVHGGVDSERDKSRFSLEVDFVFMPEVELRPQLKKGILREIDERMENCRDLLHNIKDFPVGKDQTIEFARINLLRELFNLEREKRGEQLRSWRDRVALRKELKEILIEGSMEERILELLRV
jgi:hypothetical protein